MVESIKDVAGSDPVVQHLLSDQLKILSDFKQENSEVNSKILDEQEARRLKAQGVIVR